MFRTKARRIKCIYNNFYFSVSLSVFVAATIIFLINTVCDGVASFHNS